MPGTRCAVFGCNNSHVVTKKREEIIKYHTFPKDNNLCTEWMKRCKRAGKWNPATSCVCSVHFKESDYERDLQHELLGLPIRKKLRKTAVPSLFLPDGRPAVVKKNSERSEHEGKRNRIKVIRNIIENREPIKVFLSFPLTMPAPEDVSDEVEEENLQDKYSKLIKEHNDLKKKFEMLKLTSRRKIKLLNDQVKYYKNKYMQIDSTKLRNNKRR